MRKIFLLFTSFIIFCSLTKAPTERNIHYAGVTYYFSTSDGDDSRSVAQAQSPATPWKTLTKLNSIQSTLIGGNTVAFKRGDRFDGSIAINKAGSSGNEIIYDSYGTGPNPIISGMYTIPSWTNEGSGLFSAIIPAALSSANIVTMDGQFQPMGKLPKGNNAYYNVTSIGTNQINSSTTTTNNVFSLNTAPNCVGGEVVWRPLHWVLWRGTITAQTTTSVNYTPFASVSGGGTENPQVNYGFFLQNHPNLCTSLGEWAYGSTSHKLTVFFGGGGPTGHTVEVSVQQNIITNGGFGFIRFNNLDIRGGNTNIVNMGGASNNTFNACNLFGGGVYGIFANNGTTGSINLTIQNCTIDRVNSNGIKFGSNGTGAHIIGNTITNIGAVAGMGGSGEGQYFGIQDVKTGTVQNNIIKNIGYIGLSFTSTGNLIQNNFIDSFCTVKDDGGGIYHGGFPVTGSQVIGNIVLDGMGMRQGTSDPDLRAHGGYIDDGGSGSTWIGNTFARCSDAGIFNHDGFDLVFSNNTCYDNANSAIRHYNNGSKTTNITETGNIFFAKTATEFCFKASGGSIEPKLFFSTSNNNYWTRPIAETQTFQKLNPTSANYTLAQWQTYSGLDAASKTADVVITTTADLRFEYNASSTPLSINFSGNTYRDVAGTTYSGTMSLGAWSSWVLIKTAGAGNTAPTSNAGIDQSINLPTNSTTLNGSASNDPDGSITAYSWTLVSGPSIPIFGTPTSVSTTVSNLTSGVYKFRLQVTDNLGATGIDDIQVTVNSLNAFPVANAGADISIVSPASSATLNGSGSDPDGSIVSYAWTQIAGPNTATLTTPSLASTGATGLIIGTYTFRLTVTDNLGATDIDDIKVTVSSSTPPGGLKFQFGRFKYSYTAKGDSILWSTINESQVKRFWVQRSKDSVIWDNGYYMTDPKGDGDYFYFEPFQSGTVCTRKIWNWCVQKKTVYYVTHFWYRISAEMFDGTFVNTIILKT